MASEKNPRNLSLYGLAEELKSLEKLFLMEHGEETPELKALHEEVNQILETKADNYVNFVWSLEDDIDIAKKRKRELDAFIQARQATIERLKSYVAYFLSSTDRQRIDGELCTIAKQAGRKTLRIENEDNIHPRYLKTSVAIDKVKLTADIKEGLPVPDGVSIVEGEATIRFKKKPVQRARSKPKGEQK